jgi:hypothetical protein
LSTLVGIIVNLMSQIVNPPLRLEALPLMASPLRGLSAAELARSIPPKGALVLH